MTIITLGAPSSSFVSGVTPRVVLPQDVAKWPSKELFYIARPEMAVVASDGQVTRLANLSDPSNPLIPVSGVNAPKFALDETVGRYVLEFGPSAPECLAATKATDYTGAWTMFAVFAMSNVNSGIQAIIGNESSTAALRANIAQQAGGSFGANVYGQSPGLVFNSTADLWRMAIASFNGANTVTMELLGETVKTSALVSGDPTTTILEIGSRTASYAMEGKQVMGGKFSIDLFATANASALADLKTMVRQFMGDALYEG